MDYPTFKQEVLNFIHSEDENAHLLHLKEQQKDLAETLLLHLDILKESELSEEVFQLVYLHYVVNTDGQIPYKSEEDEPLDAEEWVAQYGQFLGVGIERQMDLLILQRGEGDKADFDWPGTNVTLSTVEQIRDAGRMVNYFRYGGDKIIPNKLFAFEENIEGHVLENALWLSNLSEAAYHHSDYLLAQLVNWDFEVDTYHWIEDERTDTQAFIAIRPNHLVLSFRGTSSFKDGLHDIKFLKTGTDEFEGRIHKGFEQAFRSVKSQVLNIMEQYAEGRRIYITGHSLGAALAQLAAYCLVEEKQLEVAGVYIFGSPKVGNRSFAEAYNERLARQTFIYINNRDIIARVPPPLLGYVQIGFPSQRLEFNHQHQLSPQEEEELPLEEPENEEEEILRTSAMNSWMQKEGIDLDGINRMIKDNTAYLSQRRVSTIRVGAYSTNESVRQGPINDHSINQYYYKLACSIIEMRWEEIQANGRG